MLERDYTKLDIANVHDNFSRTTSAESSDERLSTTTISSESKDCDRRLGKQIRRCCAPFQLTIITDTVGLSAMTPHFSQLEF